MALMGGITARKCCGKGSLPVGTLLGGTDMVSDGQPAGSPRANARPQLIVQLLKGQYGLLLPGIL